MLTKRYKQAGAHLLAIFASLIMVIPFYLIVVNSFKIKGRCKFDECCVAFYPALGKLF